MHMIDNTLDCADGKCRASECTGGQIDDERGSGELRYPRFGSDPRPFGLTGPRARRPVLKTSKQTRGIASTMKRRSESTPMTFARPSIVHWLLPVAPEISGKGWSQTMTVFVALISGVARDSLTGSADVDSSVGS